jgi:hypothetical protein
MLDPEQRPTIEQDVADRAATEGGQAADDADANRVEALACALDHPRQREGDRRSATTCTCERTQGADAAIEAPLSTLAIEGAAAVLCRRRDHSLSCAMPRLFSR